MVVDREHLRGANEHLEKSGMRHYGWLPGELRVAFHQGKISAAKLKELGGHFAEIGDVKLVASVMNAATAKLVNSPKAAFEHLLREAKDLAKGQSAGQIDSNEFIRLYREALSINPHVLTQVDKALAAGRITHDRLVQIAMKWHELTREQQRHHSWLLKNSSSSHMPDVRSQLEAFLPEKVLKHGETGEPSDVDELVQHVVQNMHGSIGYTQSPMYIFAPTHQAAYFYSMPHRVNFHDLGIRKLNESGLPAGIIHFMQAEFSVSQRLISLRSEQTRLNAELSKLGSGSGSQLKSQPASGVFNRFMRYLLRKEPQKGPRPSVSAPDADSLRYKLSGILHKVNELKYLRKIYGDKVAALYGTGDHISTDGQDPRDHVDDIELIGSSLSVQKLVDLIKIKPKSVPVFLRKIAQQAPFIWPERPSDLRLVFSRESDWEVLNNDHIFRIHHPFTTVTGVKFVERPDGAQ